MNILILVLRIIFGIFFAFAGVMHIVKPKIFNRFIPNFLPKLIINYIAGLLELAIGIGLLINQTTKQAALAMFVLMLLFLPIHIWDVFREKPAIGSKKIAIVRVPLQFLLLYIAYLIYTH
ncbi:DoxX family protein [Tenacibaculum sp. L6]|uniref:DoxX family protein n=1 Tax=Tenacibaculum sp. L6 TaxID=2992764 RepID=UPI00237BF73A|nr:MauE/DoxX family redox-associated membrane protein [Tenacibaculum sp. L6]MDE0536287.1 DoxX family membrane protein [Tenacibaculum sp. L6]